MIQCKSCGQEIASNAENCPFCGAVTEYKKLHQRNRVDSIVCIVALFIMVYLSMRYENSREIISMIRFLGLIIVIGGIDIFLAKHKIKKLEK